jgi:NAD(P)-dependent dehydrogenase (short-subunit alcohol dehydrogenase family)
MKADLFTPSEGRAARRSTLENSDMTIETFNRDLFKGRTALVTGAAGGIGKGIAEAFSALGADVVLQDVQAKELEQMVEATASRGRKAVGIPGDLSQPGIARKVFVEALAVTDRIDFLVNNAGRSWGVDTCDIDDDTAQELIELNFKSVLSLSREYVRHARRRGGGGAIVQISSTAGIAGFQRRAVYCGTKFGVVGLTKVLALDHAREGIRVNAVLPHVVETEMFRTIAQPKEVALWGAAIPMGRFATVEEVAALVMFLCSPAASYLTGGTYPVDGGYMAGSFGADV